MNRRVIILLLFLYCHVFGNANEVASKEQVHIILIGSTGDLAKKYLWQGIFDLYLKYRDSSDFFIYAAGIRPFEKCSDSLKNIYENNIKSKDKIEKLEFVNNIKYFQVKTEEQFKILGNEINEKSCVQCTAGDTCSKECISYQKQNMLFYFSVPPSAYVSIAENINKHCRSWKNAGWFRVVLEKPFGNDLDSAKDLACQLSKHLKENEMYRIDHYLGKPVLRSILDFRRKNIKTLSPVWNGDFIERIDIGMTEKVDVKGRISFYDKYGAIRDVIQNHIMEILSLLTMEIPNDGTDVDEFERLKISLLNSITPVTPENTLIGQYDGYTDEAASEFDVAEFTSQTETFAAAQIQIENGRWKGVPVNVKAGKKMDTRLSWATIVFKRFGPYFGSIHFIIESSDVKGIFVNGNLPKTVPPELFKKVVYKSSDSQTGTYTYKPPNNALGAYHVLIEAAFNGEKNAFVSTESLLASWKIWTPVLMKRSTLTLEIYRNESDLSFITKRNKIEFVTDDLVNIDNYDFKISLESNGIFINEKLFTGSKKNLINEIASRLFNISISKPQENIHIAVSGGSAAKELFSTFSKLPISWKNIHIWLVDERCVPLNDENSNYKILEDNLINDINIPYKNVHPMPVNILGICNETGIGPTIYEASINDLVSNTIFDIIILGVGPDGHTASLFPGQPSLKSENLVTLSDANEEFDIRKRMTMTYKLINKAKNIFVLIIGKSKREIVKKIKSNENNYPISGVRPSNGNLEWFIDDHALGSNN